MLNDKLHKLVLWITLVQIYELMMIYEKHLFSSAGLTNQQFKILMTMALVSDLQKREPVLTDLVPIRNRSLVGISLIVNRMEKKGLLKKEKNPKDRREINLIMTQKGKNALKETAIPTKELGNDLFPMFSNKDLLLVISKLQKVENRLRKLCINEGKKIKRSTAVEMAKVLMNLN
jgi:DNA-binding MarR family transcriptional regulator